jgi:tetratricopeptide (TPR) repeat protein
MSTEAEEFTKKATELRSSGRIDEAILAARKATTLDPELANAWWQLALSVADKDGDLAALAHFKKTVELAPNFSYGWSRLGTALHATGSVDEAEEAWLEAVETDPESVQDLRILLALYKERKAEGDKLKLLDTLEKLDALKGLTNSDIHTLAIAYYNKGEHLNAIHHYKRYLAQGKDSAGYFNLGLAYSQESISQDADAVDCWKMSLRLKPGYERAEKSIADVLPKLQQLRNKVLALQEQSSLLTPDQLYINYINPFELLQLSDVTTDNDLEVKDIQKAKKQLLQEVELEDGAISWMPHLTIDRSRAIQVVDDLSNQTKEYFHLLVNENKDLLNFLSRGRIDHFLVDPNASQVTIFEQPDLLIEDFTAWVSGMFSKQYNIVFAKALERREPALIEAMLDGRRWVLAEDEDKCFELALRQCDSLLEPLRKIEQSTKSTKPTLSAVKQALETQKSGEILTLLPSVFQNILNEAADLIRNISVSANNDHHDPDQAKAILALAKNFAARAPSVRLRIEKDAQTLDDIIKREKAHESFLTFGGKSYSITRDGATFAEKKLLVSEIETLRWGMTYGRVNGVQSNEYNIVIGGPGAKTLSLSWKSTNNISEQQELFSSFVEAAVTYLLPQVTERLGSQLKKGGTLLIGGVSVSKHGVVLKTQGWFSTKEELCPWARLKSEISNGDLIISDKASPKAKVELPLGKIDNAWVLHWMVRNGF